MQKLNIWTIFWGIVFFFSQKLCIVITIILATALTIQWDLKILVFHYVTLTHYKIWGLNNWPIFLEVTGALSCLTDLFRLCISIFSNCSIKGIRMLWMFDIYFYLYHLHIDSGAHPVSISRITLQLLCIELLWSWIYNQHISNPFIAPKISVVVYT